MDQRQDTARRVTMTDVARLAGCSQATVSFVLNHAPGVRISAATRARVIEAARSLDYAPAPLAHRAPPRPGGPSAASSSRGVIGFVVDQLATSPEAVVAIDGARLAAWEEGRLLLSAQTMNDAAIEAETVASLLARGVEGLVWMTIFTRQIALPPALAALPIPLVLLNCADHPASVPAVVPAERAGGERIGRRLLEAGHRRIGMITGEPWMSATRDRIKGFRRALAEFGVDPDPALTVQGNWQPSSGWEGARRLLALPHRPTAIWCQNDRMAIGAYEAIKEARLRIPQDISVAGYDDEEIARHLNPQLSTVVLPHRQMGQWAVERLLAGDRTPGVTAIEGALIERSSIGPPS